MKIHNRILYSLQTVFNVRIRMIKVTIFSEMIGAMAIKQ